MRRPPHGSALPVILGHEVVGYIGRQRGARTGEGSHNDVVAAAGPVIISQLILYDQIRLNG